MDGFKYRGKALSEFGDVYYVPNEEQRAMNSADYEIYEQEVSGRDGGYRMGVRVKPREFEQSLFYENMETAQLNRIMQWFDRRTRGDLIFDDRPFACYTAYPNGRPEIKDYIENRDGTVKHHGTMLIRMKAYDPFAKVLPDAIMEEHICGAKGEILMLGNKTPETPSTDAKNFLLYNCGTEETPLTIRMAGESGDRMVIRNKTTGQECVIHHMTKGVTGDAGKILQVDSGTGRVELIGMKRELAFEMHDGGYISLAPNCSFETAALARYTSGSKTVTLSDGAYEEMAGQYIYLNGAWRKIDACINTRQISIDTVMTKNGAESTMIVTMNEMEIEGGELTLLECVFEPKVR